SPEDLIWTAIEKTLNGTRKWDAEHVGIVDHLMGVVSSELYNRIRKQKLVPMETLYSSAIDILPSDEASPEEITITRSEFEGVFSYLKKRDERLAELAYLYVAFRATSADELAAMMDLPRPTIYALKRSLRRALADYMRLQSEDGLAQSSSTRS